MAEDVVIDCFLGVGLSILLSRYKAVVGPVFGLTMIFNGESIAKSIGSE